MARKDAHALGQLLKLLTPEQQKKFIDLLAGARPHRPGVQTTSGDDCDICKKDADSYWQENYGENWAAAKQAYCEALECGPLEG